MTSLKTNFNTQTATAISLPSSVTVQTMSSKDLLEVINQVRESFDEPIIRLNKFNEKIEDELDGDYYTKSVVQNLNGTESVIYQLTEEQCTLISMRESKLVRRTVLNQLKMLKPRTPQTYKEALQFLIEAEEKKEQLALQVAQQQQVIEHQKPTVDAYEMIAGKRGSLCFQEAYKFLGGMKLKDMKQWLLDKKWIYIDRHNRLSASNIYTVNGYLVVKATQHQPQIRITYKGLAAIARQMKIKLNPEDFN